MTIRPMSPIAPRRRAFVGPLLLVLFTLLQMAPAHAFQVWRHSSMTTEVLGRQGVSGNVLSLIAQGARRPDINQCVAGCYCPEIVFYCDPSPGLVTYFSQFHYDNNQLAEGRAHVELYMAMARDRINVAPPTTEAGRREVGLGWIYFGVALHAIQDFYAHSTWVENNRDLVRIGGRIDSAPLWNGEDNWGTGTTVVGGVTVGGVQTGYERLPTPAGSVSHAALNKDHANTAQGQITVNRIFPSGLIGTYYEIASGQNGPSGGSYKDTGLAPRHTIKAWQCLQPGCAVYQLPEFAAAEPTHPARIAQPFSVQDFAAIIAFTNSDPGMTAAATFMDSVWNAADQDSPQTFPAYLFDEEGWPLPQSTSVEDVVGPVASSLDRVWPNPSRGHVSIRFRLPRAEHVKLDVFDAAGRKVATLVDYTMEPGWKEVVWDGARGADRRLPSGSYLCRLTTAGRVETCRVSLLR